MSTLNHGKNLLLNTFGGMNERIYCDHDHGADMLIKTSQDCAPVMRENKFLAEEQDLTNDFRLVARFPTIFLDQAMREGWVNDEKKWEKLINDPDYAAFRVWPGKI